MTKFITFPKYTRLRETNLNDSNNALILSPLPHSPDFLTTLIKRPFENILGKGESAGNQHFLPFP